MAQSKNRQNRSDLSCQSVCGDGIGRCGAVKESFLCVKGCFAYVECKQIFLDLAVFNVVRARPMRVVVINDNQMAVGPSILRMQVTVR